MHKASTILTFLILFNITTFAADDSAAIKRTLIEKTYTEYEKEFELFQKQHGHFIVTPNVKMHYVTYGKPSGTPIIWCHGTYGTALEIYSIADSLVKRGYYVIAIEYYGHGMTPAPNKDLTLWHVADDIKCLMDRLKIKKAILGGFSRGGSVVTAFYNLYPDRVKAIVLEDGGSVAWHVNRHAISIDSAIREIYGRFEKGRRKLNVYQTPIDAFASYYEENSKKADFKMRAFSFFSRITQNKNGEWVLFNPDLNELLYQDTPEQIVDATYRSLSVHGRGMFAASTNLVYPKIIYRNLSVPMLIFDPVGENDLFDFEKENGVLQQEHRDLITHKIYKNTSHQVKFDRPDDFVHDLVTFLSTTLKKR